MTPLFLESLEPRALPTPYRTLPVLPFDDPAVADHARAIVAHGQFLGRRSDVVLKLGDSNSSIVNWPRPTFLVPLGMPDYNPAASGLSAAYPELQDTWNAFRWSPNSFLHEGPGAYPGWTSEKVLQAAGSQAIATGAGIALVMIGTNDYLTGVPLARYRANLSNLVETLLLRGVLPVLSTIPDSHYQGGRFEPRVHEFNQAIADTAERYTIPLWNAWRAWHALPNQGLLPDGTHLSVAPAGGGSFWPADLLFGQNVRNRGALQILDWYRESIVQRSTIAAPNEAWEAMPVAQSLYAVGRDMGVSSLVDTYDAATGRLVNRFLAFGPRFAGGVRVATGDVNGDGFTDVLCATSSRRGIVRVFSGFDGSELFRVEPFGSGFRGGLTIAAGDLNGDGMAEVVVGREGNGSGVRVYGGGTFALATALRAFESFDAGGVSVSVAAVEGYGAVLTVGATGPSPVYALFDTTGARLGGGLIPGGDGSGISLAAADLTGDGFDELCAASTSGGRFVSVIDPVSGERLARFDSGSVNDPLFGLRLAALRTTGEGADRLLVASAPGMPVGVRVFAGLSGDAEFLEPDPIGRAFGIFVG